ALNPAQVVDVTFNEKEGSCVVVVPDYQLSLAIGKRGQNARLAAKLTGYKIDIKSESDMQDALAAEEEAGLVETADYAESLEETLSAEQENSITEVVDSIEDQEDFASKLRIDDDVEEGVLDPEEAEEMIELAED